MKSLDQLCIWKLFEINIEETQGITLINAYENCYKEASIK